MRLEKIREGFDLLDQGMRVLASGPIDYYIRNLVDCYELLLERFAPFHIGDRVILTKSPDIPTDSGWNCARHFLVKGAVATVRMVEADNKGFTAQVEFDDETWIDHKGERRRVEYKHTYGFREDYLVRLSPTVNSAP